MVRRMGSGDSSRGRLLLLGALVFVGAVGIFAEASDAGQTGSNPPAKVGLAVLPFSGSADKLPEGFGFVASRAIGYALQQVRGVSLLDSGRIVESAERLGLSPTERISDEDLLRLGRELKLRGIVTGS